MGRLILNSALALFLSFEATASTQKNVEITSPKDGDTITSPATFQFRVLNSEWKVAPAGPLKPNTGHHHILVNKDSIAKGRVIPTDESHIHFGKGQTEAAVTLSPGEHRITLQFADGAHVSYGPEWSHTIRVKVK